MLYYSMQVIWPRESALLFVPADKPIIRGIYANLTTLASWGEFFLSCIHAKLRFALERPDANIV
jgi:hypothetical protein